MKEKYITDDEREKCKKVADAFAELYEIENILVVDAGRYGFVKLQYYRPPEAIRQPWGEGRALSAGWQKQPASR